MSDNNKSWFKVLDNNQRKQFLVLCLTEYINQSNFIGSLSFFKICDEDGRVLKSTVARETYNILRDNELLQVISTRGELDVDEELKYDVVRYFIQNDIETFSAVYDILTNNISGGFRGRFLLLKCVGISALMNNVDDYKKYKKQYSGRFYDSESVDKELYSVFRSSENRKLLKNLDNDIVKDVVTIILKRDFEYFRNCDDVVDIALTVLKPKPSSKLSETIDEYLIATGQIDKISKKNSSKYKALRAFTEGDYDTAEIHFENYQAEYNNKAGSRKKFIPGYSGLFYTLLLLRKTSDKSIVRAYINNGIKFGNKNQYNPLLRFYKAKYEGAESNVIGTIQAYINENNSNLMAYLSLFWVDKNYIKKFKEQAQNFLKHVDKNGYLFCRNTLLKILDESSVNETGITDFGKGGVHPLCNIIQPDEEWEKILGLLEGAGDSVKTSKTTDKAESRISWHFYPENLDITPVEQKLLKSGAWSKGRNISLKRMMDMSAPYMTNQDKAIASTISKENSYYYGSSSYVFDKYKALEFLAGHPQIFLSNSPETRVEIVKSKPELTVNSTKDGFEISLPQIMKSAIRTNYFIAKESLTKYILFDIDHSFRAIVELLRKNEVIKIPAKAKDRIAKTLEVLSSKVNIDADFISEEVPVVKSDSTPLLQMIPANGGIVAKLLVRPFVNDGPYFVPAEGRVNVITTVGDKKLQTQRNIKSEQKNIDKVISDLRYLEVHDIADDICFEDPEDCLGLLYELKNYKGKLNVEWPKGEKIRISHQLDFKHLNINIEKSNDWFSVDGELRVNKDFVLSIKELLDKISVSNKEFIKLDEGEYIALTKQLKRQLSILNASSKTENDKLMLHPLMSQTIEDFKYNGSKLKGDKQWKDNQKHIESIKTYSPVVPSTLQAELRPYQVEGFNWMMKLSKWGVGACLADDMGLGKTIQSLSVLVSRAENGPSLIVAPASVCSNWVTESRKFAPTLNPVVFNGANRSETIKNLKAYDILVVSYGLIQTEIERLAAVNWNSIVLDEAHAIKNINAKRTKAIMKLNSEFKIVTTGTPLQNNLEELWSLFNFINPGLLFTHKEFLSRFVNGNGDSQRSSKYLKSIIQPFILRRTKTQVLEDLPEKTEITLSVELNENETAFYEALRESAIEKVESSDNTSGGNHIRVLAEITKLRQACCNPKLIDKNWGFGSSKLELFEHTLDELLENNHKTLVFSQFVSHLSIIRELLEKKGISYQYLDGSTPLKKREESVKAFQLGEGDVFLISLKAGGLGLNLTAADYVIHMDPWWNPAIEDQASDRAHRIGQERPVTIYRFVTKNTIEEKIVKLHHDKRDMADSLLEGADASSKLSADDMIKLLKGEI